MSKILPFQRVIDKKSCSCDILLCVWGVGMSFEIWYIFSASNILSAQDRM